MALVSTTALPLALTHPKQPPAPRTVDPPTLLKHLVDRANFTHYQEQMIEASYNDIHRTIEGRVLVGLLSDMPTAGTPGRTFFAMDTGGFFVDDGTTWTQVNGTGAGVVFADLPASPVLGQFATVTDSNTNAWGAVIAGGGSDTVLAWFNSVAWTVIGK
jgi:hypothetical protein